MLDAVLLRGVLPISIHALRVEGDDGPTSVFVAGKLFLSTPSGWRATSFKLPISPDIASYFYPRPPGGGRRRSLYHRGRNATNFYPRPPGGGRHETIEPGAFDGQTFLSTPSGWRATRCDLVLQLDVHISIHALRVEGDRQTHCRYPRQKEFLSTPSGWRATSFAFASSGISSNFYPRPPGGGRRHRHGYHRRIRPISIHALRVEGDKTAAENAATNAISIHALRVEGDF